jgi:hypothetical protein
MTTATQLFTDRDTAGAAYAAELAAFRTAWINLRALDLACGSSAVLKLFPNGGGVNKNPVYTFRNASEWNPGPVQHPVYAPVADLILWQQVANTNSIALINGAT